jgi:acylphosphatase
MKKKKAASKPPKRLHVVFCGRVQGVGFRYTAERLALEAGVTGWVRNCPDGSVEIIAEGSETQIKKMMQDIQHSEVGRFIRQTKEEWEEHRGEFRDFRIEFIY